MIRWSHLKTILRSSQKTMDSVLDML